MPRDSTHSHVFIAPTFWENIPQTIFWKNILLRRPYPNLTTTSDISEKIRTIFEGISVLFHISGTVGASRVTDVMFCWALIPLKECTIKTSAIISFELQRNQLSIPIDPVQTFHSRILDLEWTADLFFCTAVNLPLRTLFYIEILSRQSY